MTDLKRHGRRVLVGYLFALLAGVLWGTTGPLSTALYQQGGQLTSVGFWRVALAVAGFLVYGTFRRDLFRIDRRGLLLVMLGGGFLVAIFEVAYQFAIAGAGVAGAATMLYTAPVVVAILARPLLGERLTATRLVLAVVVMVGVALTVRGGMEAGSGVAGARGVGIATGLLAACSYAGSTLLARWSVPRYGAVRVLFFELLGGVVLLGVFLPLTGNSLAPATTLAGWVYTAALGVGAVLAANFFFFAGVKRIEAAPAAVAASVEPVVGALLALALFQQQLTPSGWFGLALVVAGVAAGYLREAAPPPPAAPPSPRPVARETASV
jgi:DME family drug/metabolite transporter